MTIKLLKEFSKVAKDELFQNDLAIAEHVEFNIELFTLLKRIEDLPEEKLVHILASTAGLLAMFAEINSKDPAKARAFVQEVYSAGMSFAGVMIWLGELESLRKRGGKPDARGRG